MQSPTAWTRTARCDSSSIPLIGLKNVQGQRTPETSPRQLPGSKRTSIDEPGRAAGSRYSPTHRPPSGRSSLDNPAGTSSFTRGKDQEPLPLTPIESNSILGTVEQHDDVSVTVFKEEDKPLQQQSLTRKDSLATPSTADEDKAVKEEGTTEKKTKEQGHRDIPPKKQMTKAERRALQEAQRAAKAAAKAQNQQQPDGKKRHVDEEHISNKKDVQKDVVTRKEGSSRHPASVPRPAAFFDHLPKQQSISMEELASSALEKFIPVSCVALGKKMLDGSLRGTNKRSLALLQMIDGVISSFELSEGQSFTREFTVAVKNMVSFLVRCRPLSPAVGNVVKSIKAELGHVAADTELSNEEAKNELRRFVSTFAQDKITIAQKALSGTAASKISDGDIILTYACSSTVEQTLKAAVAAGKEFSVVIADAGPLYEGKELLTELLRVGIPCEYLLLNSLETGMNQANKVMLGAAAVMSNGAVLSRVGTAAVAMSASLANVPVIVCSETYKFHERVQLDSITNNELANPAALLQKAGPLAESLQQEDGQSNLSLLNLVYDTTPAEFVTVIITEVGALPPTSVPVVLREYRSESELMMQASAA